ncbi:MAG: cation-translocating P-type ATPase [Saprospiraceae bacterium]
MPIVQNNFPFHGLSNEEVNQIRATLHRTSGEKSILVRYRKVVWDIVTEPMFLLLFACTVLYLILGENEEAWFMIGAIFIVATISLFQEVREKQALQSLIKYSRGKHTVIRNDVIVDIDKEELIPGDHVICKEGDLIPSDGTLLQQNDFSVNESLLTGESLPIYKDLSKPDLGNLFQGSLVTSGQCVYKVTLIGTDTRLAQMGQKMDAMEFHKSPLQIEIGSFVMKMAVIGTIFFLLICLISFLQSGDITASILVGLTIAMSVLPEEIPVAYATFMALGAWRLIQKGIIVKKTDIVEALGSTHFLCLDKTGTITQNKMTLVEVYDFKTDRIYDSDNFTSCTKVIENAMWASESEPFDQMEKSLHTFYQNITEKDERPSYQMIHEYPLQGAPPSMTHIFQNIKGHTIIAIKGATESVVRLCHLDEPTAQQILTQNEILSSKGFRVLGVAHAVEIPQKFPEKQSGFNFEFLGLVAFYDPPKSNLTPFFNQIKDAGISTKIITGDYQVTALHIAEKVGLGQDLKAISQDELSTMDEIKFENTILKYDVFARISPEFKLKIIHTLQKSGIVAMTGDGVNDGLALKAAHVGISMGKNGTEIARLASSIVLTDDKIEKIADAIHMGRKIYFNLQKAIRYIISIHVPIILIVSIPIFLGWPFASIFSPIHIIFLELLMGPTCSIVYENEPPEPDLMKKPPIQRSGGFISVQKISFSVFQGLVITLSALSLYYWGIDLDKSGDVIRTMIFIHLIIANIILTLTNRSFQHSAWTMLKTRNNLLVYIILLTLAMTFSIILIPSFRSFFQLTMISTFEFIVAISLGFFSVIWFEVYKWNKRRNQ